MALGKSYAGEIRIFAGTFAPRGWALCEGQLLQVDRYPVRFALLGSHYGTLIDTAALAEWVGERAPAFAAHWRDKQLEYSFRRALMQNYVDFSVCTRQALAYTPRQFAVSLSQNERERLLGLYRTLPACRKWLTCSPQVRNERTAYFFGHQRDRRDWAGHCQPTGAESGVPGGAAGP